MSETPPALAEESKSKCCKNPWLVGLIVSIFGMILPPIIGVSGTVFGMVGAFDTLGTKGGENPEVLANAVSQSMTTTMIGLVISFIFLIFFVISLVMVLSNKKRKQS